MTGALPSMVRFLQPPGCLADACSGARSRRACKGIIAPKLKIRMHALPAIARAVLLCSLIFPSWVHSAGESTVDTIQASLDATLGPGAIPDVRIVIPGYRTARVEPGIVIGVFLTRPREPAELGLALSEIVVDLVTHMPDVALQKPFTHWEALLQDGFHPDHDPSTVLSNLDSLRTVGMRLGISSGVIGELDLRESDFQLTLTWYNLASGAIEATQQVSGPTEELPGLPSTVARMVLNQLGHQLTASQREYLEAAAELTAEQLAAYVQLLTVWRREGAASAAPLARKLVLSAPGFAGAARARLQLAGSDGEELAMNAFVSELAALFPDHSGVQLAAVGRWQSEGDERSIRTRHQWLQAILADDPNSMQAMWLFVEALLESGRASEASSVALETLKRWPENYRSWWLLAEAMRHLAWQKRGSVEDYAEAVEFGTDAFLPLLSIADEAVDAALAKHPYSSQLWRLKIETKPGYSEAMLKAFRRSIGYDPHNYHAYQSAMTYSAPKWGGSVAAQDRIYRLAIENNPGEQWPHQLYWSLTGIRSGAMSDETHETGQASGDADERKTLLDYLEQASEHLGCDDECVSDIKKLAVYVGLAILILALVAVARSSNVETLAPPESTNEGTDSRRSSRRHRRGRGR